MKKRMQIGRCCCPCQRFADNFRQCHGVELPEPGPNSACEESIDGFDILRKWWSKDTGIFTHHALKTNGRVTDGFIEAIVPSGGPAGDAVRLYCTVPLPQAFSLGVDSPPPGVGKAWRLCWKNGAGSAFAVEVRGPATTPPEGEVYCYSYRVLDISCSEEEPVSLDDRIIPFYFLGTLNHILTLSICVNESKNMLVVNAGTTAEVFDEEEGTSTHRWNFAHHVPYSGEAESCEERPHCYPTWIEVPNEFPGTYTWGGTWFLAGGGGEYVGTFGFGKSKGVPKDDIVGDCACDIVGEPLFHDNFNRLNETIGPTPPYDSTDHWFNQGGNWSIHLGNFLRTVQPPTTGSADLYSSIYGIDHYIESPPGAFLLVGWDTPFVVQYDIKAPEGGITFMWVDGGYRVGIKFGSEDGSVDGELFIRKSTSPTELGTVLEERTDIPDIKPSEFYRVRLCWNGETLWAHLSSLVEIDEVLVEDRTYALNHPVDDIPNTTAVRLHVPSANLLDNAEGEYLFNNFTVWEATDNTIEPGSGGSGPMDNCGCCGPFNCEGRYLDEILKFPAGDVEWPCFWEHSGGTGEGIYKYLGSYSGQRGGSNCDLDDTIRIVVPFEATDDDGSIEVRVGDHWARVIFSDPAFGGSSSFEISANPIKVNFGPVTTLNQFWTIQMCIGMGSFLASVTSLSDGAEREGDVGIPALSTYEQPEIEHDEATVGAVVITHGLNDPNCDTCYGDQIVPCEDGDAANCAEGVIGPSTARVTFDTDYEGPDLCCDEIAADMLTSVVMKPVGSTTLSLGAACCDSPDSEDLPQCIYRWGGGGQVCGPPNFVNPDHFAIFVSLQKYSDGYRYCGELQHSGTAGGGVSGILSGISAVVAALEDGPIDCTTPPSAVIPLTCYLQVAPGFEIPFCGVSNAVIHFG